MAKTKHLKYERVRDLPNVTYWHFGEPVTPEAYPWHQAPHAGMGKVLELGCGKGEHSLAFATEDPSLFCIGVDIKSDRICVGAEQAMAAGLDNVHFLRAEITRIGEFFADRSIDEIWLTFPDPHPKERAIKKRLTAPRFLDAYAPLLAPGGSVHLKTDSDTLFAYSQESVAAWGGQITAACEDIHAGGAVMPRGHGAVSAFEDEARSQGRTIKYLAFTLER